MLVFRILCAVLMAWGVNWALSRPEAVVMLQELPEMATYAPIAAGVVGYFNLAVRQGWGFIVAFANGIWAGVLSVFLSGTLYMFILVVDSIRRNVIRDFDQFLRVFSDAVDPLIEQVFNVPLLIVSLATTAVVGVVTEVLHWALVRMRQRGSRESSNAS